MSINQIAHRHQQEFDSSSMQAIHQAAHEGNEAEVIRLVAEGGERHNAQLSQGAQAGYAWYRQGTTPLMIAAARGRSP